MDFEGKLKIAYTDDDGEKAYKSIDFVFLNHSKETMERFLNAIKKTIQEIQEETLLESQKNV